MNAIKIKTTIGCETCNCKLVRSKTIKVLAETRDAAIAECNERAKQWAESLRGQNCKVCESILTWAIAERG